MLRIGSIRARRFEIAKRCARCRSSDTRRSGSCCKSSRRFLGGCDHGRDLRRNLRARLIPAERAKDGSGIFKVDVITPDEYAKLADAYFSKNGFAEREIFRKSERYGNIMQIFSTYESRHDASDAKPFARGINSFQLLYDGKRWWVVTIYWQEEDAENPLPKEVLPAGK